MKNFSLKDTIHTVGQFLLIGLLSLTVACKDDPARISGDVLPDGEKIKGLNYEGHILTTTNTGRKKVRTSDATYGIIGTFNDPVFGQSEASFVTDFSIGSEVKFIVDILDISNSEDTVIHEDYIFSQFNNNVDTIADTWKVDSLVLNLQYQFNNWYGNMLQNQSINIFELSSPLGSNNQEFFSDHDVTGMYFPEARATQSVHPNNEVPDSLKSSNWTNLYEYPDSLWNHPQYLWNNDKVQADKDSSWLDADFNGNTTTIKYWPFKLNETLADKIFNLSESELKNSNAFKEAFNGVYVTLDEASVMSGEGWLTRINLLSSSNAIATNLTIHLSRDYKYLNSVNEIRDTISNYQYTFPVNLENVRFNTYSHELNTSNIDTTDMEPERIYIQGMAGSYMQMSLPDDVINWVDSIGDPSESDIDKDYHLAANVEFFMEIDTIQSDLDKYPAPNRLVIKWLDDKGELVDPVHTIEINGNDIVTPIFGSNADSQGNRSGIGERVIRFSDDGNPEFIYRFIMRSDYFNHIMRREGGAKLNEKQFFIGPESTTANFQRVVLYSGSEENEQTVIDGQTVDKRMKMNVKYYQYRPR